jgi:DNA-binding protein Fis
MRRSGGNQTIAAHLLGMSRTTLNKRLKKTPA